MNLRMGWLESSIWLILLSPTLGRQNASDPGSAAGAQRSCIYLRNI
jgi:hypothetical protein